MSLGAWREFRWVRCRPEEDEFQNCSKLSCAPPSRLVEVTDIDTSALCMSNKPNSNCVELIKRVKSLLKEIRSMDTPSKVFVLNSIRTELHQLSPFSHEPVDCVQWVPFDLVQANDYNPNSVAPPEMRLLEHSISEDGYTQPIVAWKNCDHYEVVDGFHRNRVGRESKAVRDRLLGYLPLTIINTERGDRGNRIAATIRHNRARGKHQVAAMSDIVVELKRRNWTDDKIGRELGMDPDEVLRLCQITGLAEMFANGEFTASWDVGGDSEEEISLENILLDDSAQDDGIGNLGEGS